MVYSLWSLVFSLLGGIMKIFSKLSLFILLFILICSVSAVYAAAQDELRYIAVTGDAEVKVVPDEVIISLGVQTQNINLTAAKAENDKIVKEVLAVTKRNDVEQKHVQTSQINIEPRYRYYENKKIFEGYFVSKTIVITLKDVSKFENIFSSVLEGGVNYVYNIQFRTTALRQLRDKARIMAIRAAYDKAKALAGELGQTLGKPYTITENSTGGIFPVYRQNIQNVMMSMDGATSTEDVLAPGEITVTSSISVKFELK